MKVTYGIEVKDADNEYIHLAENAIIGFNAAAQPGRFLVDSFSPCKLISCSLSITSTSSSLCTVRYVPAWMPGADFQRLAAHWKEVGLQMLNKPFDAVKSAVVSLLIHHLEHKFFSCLFRLRDPRYPRSLVT